MIYRQIKNGIPNLKKRKTAITTIGGSAKGDEAYDERNKKVHGVHKRRAITKVRHDDLPSAKVWQGDPPSLDRKSVV